MDFLSSVIHFFCSQLAYFISSTADMCIVLCLQFFRLSFVSSQCLCTCPSFGLDIFCYFFDNSLIVILNWSTLTQPLKFSLWVDLFQKASLNFPRLGLYVLSLYYNYSFITLIIIIHLSFVGFLHGKWHEQYSIICVFSELILEPCTE
jgi:hypothetical protein